MGEIPSVPSCGGCFAQCRLRKKGLTIGWRGLTALHEHWRSDGQQLQLINLRLPMGKRLVNKNWVEASPREQKRQREKVVGSVDAKLKSMYALSRLVCSTLKLNWSSRQRRLKCWRKVELTNSGIVSSLKGLWVGLASKTSCGQSKIWQLTSSVSNSCNNGRWICKWFRYVCVVRWRLKDFSCNEYWKKLKLTKETKKVRQKKRKKGKKEKIKEKRKKQRFKKLRVVVCKEVYCGTCFM